MSNPTNLVGKIAYIETGCRDAFPAVYEGIPVEYHKVEIIRVHDCETECDVRVLESEYAVVGKVFQYRKISDLVNIDA